MKQAVLLNDTSSRYHHGCIRVSRRIKTLLSERGIKVIASNPAHQDWRRNDNFLAALKICDVIIINGEGTLHSGRKNGAILLDILSSEKRRGKPVALVNAIWQGNPADWNALLKKCDIVSVRDSHSANELSAAGVAHARLVPDLSLTGPLPLSDVQRCQVVIGDSVRFRSRQALAKAAQFQAATYIPTKYLRSPIWNNRIASAALWRLYNGVPFGRTPEFRMVQSDESYLLELQRTKAHITGRFHGACFSLIAYTPFLAMASNTTKIQTLIDDAGLDRRRIISNLQLETQPDMVVPAFSERELESIKSYISNANSASQHLFDDIRNLI